MPAINLFFLVYLSRKINWGFFGRLQQSNACAGQKKTHVLFGNVRPRSNARAHLKQRKNIVALTIIQNYIPIKL